EDAAAYVTPEIGNIGRVKDQGFDRVMIHEDLPNLFLVPAPEEGCNSSVVLSSKQFEWLLISENDGTVYIEELDDTWCGNKVIGAASK
ncbi:hypothetical protein BGX31_004802, partial [Mortierella sp. GBA43]